MVFNQRTLTDIDGQTLEFTGTYTLLLEGEVGQGAVAGYDFAVYPTRMQDALLPIGERIDSTIAQPGERSEEHTSELQSLMRISYAVFCLKKKKKLDKAPNNPNTL